MGLFLLTSKEFILFLQGIWMIGHEKRESYANYSKGMDIINHRRKRGFTHQQGRFNGDTIWLKFNGDMMEYAVLGIYNQQNQPFDIWIWKLNNAENKDYILRWIFGCHIFSWANMMQTKMPRTVWWRVGLRKMRNIRKNGEATWKNWECVSRLRRKEHDDMEEPPAQRGRPKVATGWFTLW